MGKCLKAACDRLPARELLLDPFLASDDGGRLVLEPKASSGSSTPKTPTAATELMVPPIIAADLLRNTNMTITGSMNSEDDAIYLKVQITGKDGTCISSCYVYIQSTQIICKRGNLVASVWACGLFFGDHYAKDAARKESSPQAARSPDC